ncbi:MAG: hypothetical protein ACK58L_08715 [Planctomycetota bacterium]
MATRRFVILEHDHPFWHWDFLVQGEAMAATWRLMREPCLGEPIYAERLADHRLMYLDYEGPVSNNRGHVRRVLSGDVTSEMFPEDPGVERVLTLGAQNFASRVVVFHTQDGRCFFQFS